MSDSIWMMSSLILSNYSRKNDSIHHWPYIPLMQLRDGENQIPIPAPNDITPFDTKPLEIS